MCGSSLKLCETDLQKKGRYGVRCERYFERVQETLVFVSQRKNQLLLLALLDEPSARNADALGYVGLMLFSASACGYQ